MYTKEWRWAEMIHKNVCITCRHWAVLIGKHIDVTKVNTYTILIKVTHRIWIYNKTENDKGILWIHISKFWRRWGQVKYNIVTLGGRRDYFGKGDYLSQYYSTVKWIMKPSKEKKK